MPPLLKVTCCIRHFFNSFPCCIPPLFLRYGKGPGMVRYEQSPGNLFGLTKKSYVPRVALRFSRNNFFRNSCFYVFMTRYFFLISNSNCSRDFLSIWGDRNTIYKTRDSGDQNIESLCVSLWSLLYNFFLAYTSSCSIDQKHPSAPQNGPNHHPSRLSTGVLIRLFPSPEIQLSTGKDLFIPRGQACLEASYLSPISPPFLLLVR